MVLDANGDHVVHAPVLREVREYADVQSVLDSGIVTTTVLLNCSACRSRRDLFNTDSAVHNSVLQYCRVLPPAMPRGVRQCRLQSSLAEQVVKINLCLNHALFYVNHYVLNATGPLGIWQLWDHATSSMYVL